MVEKFSVVKRPHTRSKITDLNILHGILDFIYIRVKTVEFGKHHRFKEQRTDGSTEFRLAVVRYEHMLDEHERVFVYVVLLSYFINDYCAFYKMTYKRSACRIAVNESGRSDTELLRFAIS